MPDHLEPTLRAIRSNIDALDAEIKKLTAQRERLVKARDLLAPDPRALAAQPKRGRPPTKSATIRQTLLERLAHVDGRVFQSELGRGIANSYVSRMLKEMEAEGLIRRETEMRGERLVNVVIPLDRERLRPVPPAAQPRTHVDLPPKIQYGWTPSREKVDAVLAFLEEQSHREHSVPEIAAGVGLSRTTVDKCLGILRGEHRVRMAGRRPERGKPTVYRAMPSPEGIPNADVADPLSITPNNGVTHGSAV